MNIADYIQAARPYVAKIMSRGGSLAGRAAMFGGPLGAAANAATTAYPHVADSNFPDIRRMGNPMARAAQGFGGMSPSDTINAGFGTIAEQQPASDPQLAQRFLEAIQRRNGTPNPPHAVDMPQPRPQQVSAAAAAPQEPVTHTSGPLVAPEDPGLLQRFFQGIYDNFGNSGPAQSGPRFGPFPQ